MLISTKKFEYAAMGKPVWAGVAGYAAEFVNNEISNAGVFEPCNVDEAIEDFDSLAITTQSRLRFIEKYSRKNIMREMAGDIIGLLEKKCAA